VLCSASSASCPPLNTNPKWYAPDRPPLAGQWGDPTSEIPGFQIVGDDPQPGDVVGFKHPHPETYGASGHVGIVVEYDPTTKTGKSASVSSTTEKVEITDWGFRPGQSGQVVFRRVK
jgi:hypothetical protein